MRYLATSAATSFLLCSVQANAFAPSATQTATKIRTMTTAKSSSSLTAGSEAIAFPFPKAVSVPPGTSPVETQEKVNPIDSTCTVLVVGGNRGIGLEFVKQCLDSGATVIATHRSEDVPSELESLQKKYSHDDKFQFYPLQMDLSSEESIEHASMTCKSLCDDIDSPLTHIIHNAGIYLPGTSFDGTARGPRDASPKVDKETLMKTFEINTIAPLLVAQHFTPLMGKRPSQADDNRLYPVYAFVTSKVGSVDDNGSGGAYAYRSSKSALNNIAKSMSIDLADDCRVVLLHPGWVRTDMTGGKGLIDVDESVRGMLNAVEATDASTAFRFVDYKACQIPW